MEYNMMKCDGEEYPIALQEGSLEFDIEYFNDEDLYKMSRFEFFDLMVAEMYMSKEEIGILDSFGKEFYCGNNEVYYSLFLNFEELFHDCTEFFKAYADKDTYRWYDAEIQKTQYGCTERNSKKFEEYIAKESRYSPESFEYMTDKRIENVKKIQETLGCKYGIARLIECFMVEHTYKAEFEHFMAHLDKFEEIYKRYVDYIRMIERKRFDENEQSYIKGGKDYYEHFLNRYKFTVEKCYCYLREE